MPEDRRRKGEGERRGKEQGTAAGSACIHVCCSGILKKSSVAEKKREKKRL